jgi:uncharacterized protein YbjQ (UPF0145 family)
MPRLRITEIDPGSPAQRLGLQPGDVIYSCNGKPIEMMHRLAEARTGVDESLIVVLRGDEAVAVTAKPGPLGISTEEVPLTKDEATALYRAALARLPITTTETLPGARVLEVLDVVTAENALNVTVFSDFLMGITEVAAGRNATMQAAIRKARSACLTELREEALLLGGNAVIGVSVQYVQFTGGSKSIILMAASGTAARTEALP